MPTRGRTSGAEEAGFSLIEVMVALTVLMAVLLPTASLLITTNQVIGTSQYRGTAEELAQSDVSQLQAAAVAGVVTVEPLDPPCASTTVGCLVVPSTFPLQVATPNGTTSPSWPTSWASGSPVTSTIQTETYTQYIVGDWCGMASSTATSWAPASSGAVVYVVAVLVVWGPSPSTSAAAGSSVMAYGGLTQQSAWTGVPTASEGSGGSTTLCPTNLS